MNSKGLNDLIFYIYMLHTSSLALIQDSIKVLTVPRYHAYLPNECVVTLLINAIISNIPTLECCGPDYAEMKVASEKRRPSSTISSSPTLIFKDVPCTGEYYGLLDIVLLCGVRRIAGVLTW